MNVRFKLALILAKVLIHICRLLGLGGTTLPGRAASVIFPGIIARVSKDVRIIMVTGTNGKTTTSGIIGQILGENSIAHISNKSGANLLSGITTTFISNISLNGKVKNKTAVIEIDEAVFNTACDYIEPDILVVTNFFRDQLDRYGELYTTLKNVNYGIEKLNKTKLVLNADDSLCASLGKDTSKQVIYYGFSEGITSVCAETLNTDAVFCLYCKSRYGYTNRIYAHLGSFACPECGYRKPIPHISCTDVTELNSSYSSIRFSISTSDDETGSYEARINLPGLYNIYNSLAAIALGKVMELPSAISVKALANFECGFGRMETIAAGEGFIRLILVKNPAGFNQVLNYLLDEHKNMQIAFLINDNYADGTDISWLWDVDFEKLNGNKDRIELIYTSGKRAEDMALRLKYADFYSSSIQIVKDYRDLLNRGIAAAKSGTGFYILPTYTAMFEIRKILKKRFNLKDFWR